MGRKEGRSIDFLTLPSSDRQTVRRIDRRLDCASEELQSGAPSQTVGFEENFDGSVDRVVSNQLPVHPDSASESF